VLQLNLPLQMLSQAFKSSDRSNQRPAHLHRSLRIREYGFRGDKECRIEISHGGDLSRLMYKRPSAFRVCDILGEFFLRYIFLSQLIRLPCHRHRRGTSPKTMEDQMTISSQTVERCIEECLQCLRWCAQCRAESLDEDPIMMRDCIRLCNECLELCRTCVALLAGSSGFAHRLCGICSELCAACAAECGKHEGETMRKCAEACRQCAATCAEVAHAGPIQRAAA